MNSLRPSIFPRYFTAMLCGRIAGSEVSQDSLPLFLSFHRIAGIIGMIYCAQIYAGSGDLHLDLYTSAVKVVPAAPFPWALRPILNIHNFIESSEVTIIEVYQEII